MSVFLRNLSKSPKYKRRTFAAAGSTFGEMTTSIGGAAFPTVSPTASTSRKSFFDTSAAVGTTISGHALVAVFPVNEKKGRAKQCFVTVQQTLFEVHKNQKDAKNKKPAKHLVDFGDVFNVSIHNEPIQIKDDCICIMDLSTSFFVRPIDSDYDLTAWFDWILERTRECRSTKLLRPVFREEFFEAAWDVQIVRRPKFRHKQQPDPQNEDLAEKRVNLLGFRRLCFCGTSFLIFSIGCRPISNVEASEPFERSAFVQLPLNVVSNYGTQERFFFIRVGRCSEIGGGELWMATEHGASARSMHERISQLNVRESERRRAQGIKINLPTISSSVLKSRAHRERSQTQIQLQKTNSQLRFRCIQPQSAKSTCSELAENCSSRKASSNSTSHVKNQHHHASNGSLSGCNSHQQLEPIRTLHAGRTDSISSGLHSIPEQRVMNDELNILDLDQDQHQQEPVQLNLSDGADCEPKNGGHPMKKSSIAGLFASRFGAKMSAGTCGRPLTANMDQITAPSSPAAQTAGMTFEFNGKGRCATASLANLASSTNQSARNSLVGSVLGFRLTRNSNNNSNNCCNNASATSANRQTTAQRIPQTSTSAAAIFSAQPSYDCAEDYMTLYDADNNVMMGGLQQQHYGYSLNAPSGSVGSRMSAVSKAESRKSSSSVAPHRQCSTGSTGYSSDTQQHGKALALIPADYVEMEAFESHVDAEPEFSLSEVHSYVPSSFEPCCSSSAATNNNSSGTHWTDFATADSPRAYSLGSKPDSTHSGCSVRPSSSEMSRSPQLLHPSSNSSPPNYLKKSILGQTAKNLHKEALEANFCGRVLQKEGVVDSEGKKANVGIIGEMPTDDKASEIRKRAHSTGSKALIKSSLKKFTASSIAFNNRKTVGIDDELFSTDVPNSRRNTCEANKSMCSSSTCYPHSEDHVEIDFDRDESPSVGSLPSLHSRNSSIGVMSSGVRSALDSLGREKPSERLIREQIGTTPATTNENVQQIGRKRSVPEMLKGSGSTNNQPMCTETIEQNRLHPHRRLTYDGSALSSRMRPNEKRTHQHQQFHHNSKFGKSPPRRVPICREPSRQSTSSGISTSKSNESSITTTTAEAGGGYHPQNANTSLVEAIVERKESDECDYVLMLNTPEKKGKAETAANGGATLERKSVQQQLSVRTIGTIVESSSSPCSSIASAESSVGGTKSRRMASGHTENGKKKVNDNNLQMTPLSLDDFPDEYHELTPPLKLPNQHVSATKSRSPSCSPQTQTRRPHRQFSQHVSHSTARSFYPTDTDETAVSPRSSTRRKASSSTLERPVTCAAKSAGQPPEQHHRRRGHQLRDEWAKKRDGQKVKDEDEQQQHCDYAIISTSNASK